MHDIIHCRYCHQNELESAINELRECEDCATALIGFDSQFITDRAQTIFKTMMADFPKMTSRVILKTPMHLSDMITADDRVLAIFEKRLRAVASEMA